MTPDIDLHSQSLPVISLSLADKDLEKLGLALLAKQAASPSSILQNWPIVADLSALTMIDSKWLIDLRQYFERHSLHLIGVSGCDCDSKYINKAGLMDIVFSPGHRKTVIPNLDMPAVSAIEKTSEEKEADNEEKILAAIPRKECLANNKIFNGNVRSGQQISSDGDLTIIGTVSAGAEIIADGNIYVLGTLRGRAFAGNSGELTAHIFATEFACELVSIAGNYQTMEQLEAHRGRKNCLVSLNKDETMQFTKI